MKSIIILSLVFLSAVCVPLQITRLVRYNHPVSYIGMWDDVSVTQDEVLRRGASIDPTKEYFRKITYRETNVRNGLLIDTKYDTLTDEIWHKDKK